MSRILVTGANGQLASALRSILPKAVYLSKNDLDITDDTALGNYFVSHGEPDIIINTAAYTNVDKAEEEIDLCNKVNAIAPGVLATYCNRFIHISTDYVFNGSKKELYTENDSTSPINQYGRSKLQGEIAALTSNKNTSIIRTSWLYSETGKNFFTTMLRLAKDRPQLSIVNDQIGSPTYCTDLANTILKLIDSPNINGVFHFSNQGTCSWYDFASLIFELKNINMDLRPIPTTAYPTPASRPKFSGLDSSKLTEALHIEIPTWQDGLKRCIAKL